MAETKEELNTLKEEFETLNKKLVELTEEELSQVMGGKTLPSQANIPWGQFVQITPTSLYCAAETLKFEDISKTTIK